METITAYSPTPPGIGSAKTGLVKRAEFDLIEIKHLAPVAFVPITVLVVKLFEESVGTLSFYEMSENGEQHMMNGGEFVSAIVDMMSSGSFR